MNRTRYCDLLRQHVIPALRERGALDSTVFMQDGAPPHIVHGVTRLLRNRIISRSFQNVRPPRSPDLNPCDFWLWGYLSDRVYQREAVEQSLVRFQAVLHADDPHIQQRL